MLNIVFEKVGERLKYAREAQKISMEDAANFIGVHKATISRWESGYTNKIKLHIIESLANYYQVNASWLAGNDVPMNIQYSHSNVHSPSSATVFVYGTIPAGTPVECIEDILDTEEIPISMLKGGKQYFGLKIRGDSMFPTYLDGDTLIIEKTDVCESGDDCIVMVNGNDGTFKRVYKSENGITLQPLNTSYPPITYTNAEIETLPVKILGIVVEFRRKVRK